MISRSTNNITQGLCTRHFGLMAGFILLSIISLTCEPLFAQQRFMGRPDSDHTVRKPAVEPLMIEVIWKSRIRSRDDGLDDSSLLKTLNQSSNQLGTKNMFFHSLALLCEAEEELERGNITRFKELLEHAKILSPDLPHPYFMEVIGVWKTEPWMVHLLFSNTVGGYKVVWNNLNTRAPFLFHFLLVLSIALAISFIFFLLIQTMRYAFNIQHDLGHLMPVGATATQRTLLTLLTIILPSLFIGGILPSIIVLALLLFPYQKWGERGVMALIVLSFLALPTVLNTMLVLSEYPHSKQKQIFDTSYSFCGDACIEDLEQRLKEAPRDYELLFTLGLLNLQIGNEEALKRGFAYLEEAKQINQKDPRLFVLLGNLYFARQDLEAAKSSYEEAIRLDSKEVSAHYNLYRLYHAARLPDDAQGELEIAAQLDPDLMHEYSRRKERDQNSYLIFPRFTSDDLFISFIKSVKTDQSVLLGIQNNISGKIPFSWLSYFAIPIGLWWLILLVLKKKFTLSAHCPQCGLPACPRCWEKIGRKLYCRPCSEYILKGSTRSYQEVVDQDKRVDNHKKRKHIIIKSLTLLSAGGGELYQGRGFLGFGLTIFVVLTIVSLFLRPLFPDPYEVIGSKPEVGLVLALVVGVPLYLIGLYRNLIKSE